MNHSRKIWMKAWIRLLIALYFSACTGCGEEGGGNPPVKNPSQTMKLVKVSRVEAVPLRGSIEYIGELSANLKVNVASEIGGSVEKVFFEKGERVKEGQILAEIGTRSIRLEVQQAEAALDVARSRLKKTERGSRPEEIRIARAAVEQAEAALKEAERNFKRIKDLHGYDAVSNSDYDSQKRAVDTARASLDSAREQLALAKQGPRIEEREEARAILRQRRAALAIARDRLRKSRLRSPCNGIIAFRHVEEGEVVGPGAVITLVVDNRRMKIKVFLSEKDILLLEKDKRFLFTIDAIPEEAFTCRLSFLSPTADPITRSFPMELTVDEPDPRMADGMTVRVRFPIVNPKKSIKVPSAWLSEENGYIGLFVVENGRASFRRVTLGSYYERKVEILSGISERELVIITPGGLESGDTVKY